MKTLTEDQSNTMLTTQTTSKTSPSTGSPVESRCLVSGGPNRLQDRVETSLTHVLNMRVGCWRPPVFVDASVADRVVPKRSR
jgi:hypothetical protein